MRFLVILILSCLSAFGQHALLYNTNTLWLTPSNTLASNFTSTAAIAITKGASGQLSLSVSNASVTDAMLSDSAAVSVLGRSVNSTGVKADIAAAANGLFLGRSNSTLGFVKIGLTNLSMYDVNPVGQTNGQALIWDTPGGYWTNANVKGYTMTFWAGVTTINPADDTTYFVGSMYSLGAQTAWTNVSTYVPISGTIRRAVFKIRIASTLGSSEDVSHYIRVNDTTDSAVTNIDYDKTFIEAISGTLNTPVVAGDLIALKIVTPAWLTNPVTVAILCMVYIE